MRKLNIVQNVSTAFHKAGFALKKHSPEILVAVGAVGTVVSTVMACKATLKVNDILEETKTEVTKANDLLEQDIPEYTEQDNKKDLVIIYTQTGVKLVRLYAPAVVLGAVSLSCMVASNNILKKRNVALAAAYATVDKSFKEYRGRVVERFGEVIDRELKYNIKAKEIDTVVVDENGGETTVKQTVDVIDDQPSQYSRFFDDYSRYWEKNPEYNLMFLRQAERAANRKLKDRGYLFLNEVYRMLDIPETQSGQIVGWIYDEECPNGDNKVDFGIYNVYRKGNREFVNGHERSILLDFNVDGDIWSLM